MNEERRVRISKIGSILLKVFLVSSVVSFIAILYGLFGGYSFIGNLFQDPIQWLIVILKVVVSEALVFFVGIAMVYICGKQLGLRYRVWGLILGWVPLANLVMLLIILHVVDEENRVEGEKIKLNKQRASEKICQTKYPILLVHGVFFRDFPILNYWGRIPDELKKNGATIYYGGHNSASAVRDSAKELERKIRQIIEDTGCEKVNIIAHSKGGLDSRCAISMRGMAPYVASLTTINTPHRGCEFAEYLLNVIPEKEQKAVATAYNAAAEKLGDFQPDFIAAVTDLTSEKCATFNQEMPDSDQVYYQSVGSVLNRSVSGRFPLNYTYPLVKHFDGRNDGLVGEKSFPWGAKFEMLTVTGKRGISHGDMIDLNRENIKDFDVREFYVQLVADLKKKGF